MFTLGARRYPAMLATRHSTRSTSRRRGPIQERTRSNRRTSKPSLSSEKQSRQLKRRNRRNCIRVQFLRSRWRNIAISQVTAAPGHAKPGLPADLLMGRV